MIHPNHNNFEEFENRPNSAWTDIKLNVHIYTKVPQIELHCHFKPQD